MTDLTEDLTDEDVTVRTTSGPTEQAEPTLVTGDDRPSEGFDYADQDLSALEEERSGVVELGDLFFELREPPSVEGSVAIIQATNDPVLLCKRVLALLVDAPEEQTPLLDTLTPHNAALLATAAIDWFDLESAIEEVSDMEAMRAEAERAFVEEARE